MSVVEFWVGTSWKMNKTLAEGEAFARALASADDTRDDRIQRFVIPPFTLIREVKSLLQNTSVKVGAQNMHWADNGAWTGEVSPVMLTDCRLDLVELGHSERRAHFGETDETVGLKTEAAVRHGLIPLICIGETLKEREAGRAEEVLERQVRGALGRLEGAGKSAPVLLAYEPGLGHRRARHPGDGRLRRRAPRRHHRGRRECARPPAAMPLRRLGQSGQLQRPYPMPAYRRAVHRSLSMERRGLPQHSRAMRRRHLTCAKGKSHEDCSCRRQRRRRSCESPRRASRGQI